MNKILLIEDDQLIIDLYKNALEWENFSVEVAKNGQEGLSKALEMRPNLILLDLTLPGLDGISVMKKLREDTWGATAPIIILTNSDTDDDILSAIINTKPAFYLIKADITPEGLILKIKETLNIKAD